MTTEVIVDNRLFKIVLRVKETYGTTRYYPVNVAATLFCDLVNQKTLTTREIDIAQRLGFGVVYMAQEAPKHTGG